MSRPYDVLIWGCTGFTGRLVVEYFRDHVGDSCKWAVGGRSQEGILNVLNELKLDVDYLLGSNFDVDEVDAVVSQTRVLINMTGPFYYLGKQLVESCVRLGTHYVDITGEVSFIKENIDLHHENAEKNDVLIVCGCGYDSIPFDLGTYFTVREIERKGMKCGSVRANVLKMKGGASGGTAHTMVNEITLPWEVTKTLMSLYSLCPPGHNGNDVRDPVIPTKHPEFGWNISHFMSHPNRRNVHRSNALLGYHEDFRYTETMSMPLLYCIILQGLLMIFVLLCQLKFTSKLARKLIPSPGTGPTKEAQENGYVYIGFIGTPDEAPEEVTKVQMHIPGDPGYSQTAIMISEAALSIVHNRNEIRVSGVVTPAVAFGDILIDRLNNAGLKYTVVDEFNTRRPERN